MAKAAPTSLRGWAGRTSRRFRRGYDGPLVSVILPVSDDTTTRIGPCLESLRNQTYRNLDIVVVPHGHTTKVLQAAAPHAEEDWRIRVLAPVAGGIAAARNHGAARARGSHLLFVSGGDDVLPHGIARLVRSVAASGSQMAVGMLEAPRNMTAVSTEAPYDTAHRTLRRGVTLAAAPVAVTDLGLGNRLIAKSFWVSAGLAFTDANPSGADVALASYAKAAAFDLITAPTYLLSRRRDGVAIGTLIQTIAGLDDWLEDQRAIWQVVEDLQIPAARDWWLWAVLDVAVQPFFDDVERADEAQWRTLQELVETILGRVDDETWHRLRAESRVKLWLVRNDHREALQRYVASRWFENGNRPTDVVDGRVFAELPVGDVLDGQIPRDTFEMGPEETPLRAVLRKVRWVDDATLALQLHCRIDYVSLIEPPEVDVMLVATDDPALRLPLAATVSRSLEANHRDGHRYQDYSWGVVDVDVPVAELVTLTGADIGRGKTWDVVVEMRARGLARAGRVDTIDDRGSAGMMGTAQLAARRVDGVRVRPIRPDSGGLHLEILPDLSARLVAVTVRGRELHGTIDPAGLTLQEIRAGASRGLGARAALEPRDGLLDFTLELPRPWSDRPDRVWTLLATTAQGDEIALAWPGGPELWLAEGQGDLVVSRTPLGECAVLEAADALVLDAVRFTDDAVEVTGHWLGAAPQGVGLLLEGRRTTVEAPLTTAADGTVTARFATSWDEWGLGTAPLPVGRYWFGLRGPADRRRVLVSPTLLAGLLDHTSTARYRARPIRLGWAAGIHLQPPLAEDEIGPYAQRSMQLEVLARTRPIEDDAVYLQSYNGASATDSQLAIHDELRRVRPDLTLYWGVADHASWVPEGGVPVVMRSRRWYELMGSARYLCLNIDVDRWYHTRPGQRLLQTFHGYPAKSMGIRMWKAKGLTPLRIEHELARTSGDWDLILTPAPEMDQYYRTEYAYDGKIHSAGYPRADMLVGPDAGRLREETRKRLGLRPDQKAVLYAPTWRDDLATTWRQAELVSHLDLEHASQALGPDYVLLMRGHRFHAQVEDRAPDAAGVVDVSAYPEINHLILAADAAVLDYSSLRFDFALTGKPMIFLVPDLADYTGGVRGFLFDYADTAPGPMVDTADEVVERLRDLPALTAEYADARAAFHEKYNYWMDGHAAERVVAAFFGSDSLT